MGYADELLGIAPPPAPVPARPGPSGNEGYAAALLGDVSARPRDLLAEAGIQPGQKLTPPPTTWDTVKDVAAKTGTAVTKGLSHIAGLPGDIEAGWNWLGDKALGAVGVPREQLEKMRVPQTFATSEDYQKLAFDKVGVPNVAAETPMGRLAQGAVEGATSMLVPGLGLTRAGVAMGAAGGLGGEAGAMLTKDSAAGRLGGAVAGTTAAAVPMLLRRAPSAAIRSATERVTPDQWTAAEKLAADARAAGTPLTGAEALAQVSGQQQPAALQRVIEQSRKGGPIVDEFMRARPDANRAAMERGLDAIGPAPANPQSVPANLQHSAAMAVQDAENARSAAVKPFYEAARDTAVPMQSREYVAGIIDEAKKGVSADVRASLDRLKAQVLAEERVGPLDSLYKAQRDKLAIEPGSVADAVEKQAAGTAGKAMSALGKELEAESPMLATGRQVYKNMSPAVDEMRQSVIGKLAEGGHHGAAEFSEQASALFPKNPDVLKPADLRKALLTLRAKNPDAVRDTVRLYLESEFNKATRANIPGENAWGGAKFRAGVSGNREQYENLKAALESLPNGKDVSRGYDTLLKVFEAQGKRQRIGSPTEQNRQFTKDLGNNSAVQELFSRPTSALGNMAEQWRYGGNTRQLAEILTNPESVRIMRQLALTAPESRRAAVLTAELMAITRQERTADQNGP